MTSQLRWSDRRGKRGVRAAGQDQVLLHALARRGREPKQRWTWNIGGTGHPRVSAAHWADQPGRAQPLERIGEPLPPVNLREPPEMRGGRRVRGLPGVTGQTAFGPGVMATE
jgi:hypothetical protein